jgi:hypothetical protein
MANAEEIAAFRVAGELPSDGRGVMLLNEDRTIAERIFRTAFRISVPTIVTLWVGVGAGRGWVLISARCENRVGIGI